MLFEIIFKFFPFGFCYLHFILYSLACNSELAFLLQLMRSTASPLCLVNFYKCLLKFSQIGCFYQKRAFFGSLLLLKFFQLSFKEIF